MPWRRIISSRNVWSLCLTYVCANYAWWFSLNYLPTFMETMYGVSTESSLGGIYKGGPLLFGAVGCLVGGWLTDQYIRRTNDRKWGRRLYGIVGHGVAGLCLMACVFVPATRAYAGVFALVIALSGFFNDLTMASSWAACRSRRWTPT